MELNVYNAQGEVTGKVEVSDKVFGTQIKPYLFWEVVRWQQAKRRAGTHQTKTRHTVSGTTHKMYKQKGTGRARHGSTKAPNFVGGGVSHGPHPRSYEFSLNKKVRAGALRSALSLKVKEEKIRILESFEMERIKTKDALAVLKALGGVKSLVVDARNEKLNMSVRNLPNHKYLSAEGLNVMDLLKYEVLILTRAALEQVQGRLGT